MKVLIGLTSCLLFFSGCVSPKYLSRPADFAHHVKGLYLEYQTGEHNTMVGEIIEVNSDTLLLLPVDTTQSLLKLSKAEVPQAEIIVSLTSNKPEAIGTWAGLINILSIGHGYYGVISLPINMLAGVNIANNAAKSTYRIKYPEAVDWEDMKKFARFPQGIPAQVDQKLIR